MDAQVVFILLFVVATAVAIATRYVRVPYTVALVIAGLVLAPLHLLSPPQLTRELLFTVFLPPLLFEASFHVEFHEFWQNRFTIFALAVPGVVVSIALTSVLITQLVGALGIVAIGWRQALLFSAIVSATDPVAVVALFRRLHAPARLTLLLESESLLNDGTAIVLYSLVIALVEGAAPSLGALTLQFAAVVGGGVLAGAAVGLVASEVIKRVDDAMIEITVTTIAAYGSFVAAEQLHASGVIATVTAGMLCGNYAARRGMSNATRIAASAFWEYIAFALNSIVFLLIGFEVSLHALTHVWREILIAYAAMTVARYAIIFTVSGMRHFGVAPLPRSWRIVLTWGGLRGALSMVLALSAPHGPGRDRLIAMTYGVVLLSIVVQGLTIARVMRWAGLADERPARA